MVLKLFLQDKYIACINENNVNQIINDILLIFERILLDSEKKLINDLYIAVLLLSLKINTCEFGHQ